MIGDLHFQLLLFEIFQDNMERERERKLMVLIRIFIKKEIGMLYI